MSVPAGGQSGRKALPQPTEDAGGNHVVHRPAELEDVADDAAGEVGVFGVGHDEEGLDLRGQRQSFDFFYKLFFIICRMNCPRKKQF